MDELYIRFENRFRGSREGIKARVKVYLPIIEPLKSIYPGGLVVDVGCGRGEWLELLEENGWQTIGVDTNRSMVDLCVELGLNAVVGDAAQYLSTLQSESVSVVSGFHIVEHLPFDLLSRLLKEAHRVLRPGGMIIFETPNPENYKVSTINFYVDPTHRNPLPPSLMQFLAEDTGFSKSVILRLNGPEQPVPSDTSWALSAHPDYSLVAQKQRSENMAEFQHFASIQSEYFDFLALLNNDVNQLKSELNGVRRELNKARTELNGLRSELNGVRNELIRIHSSIWWRISMAIKNNNKIQELVGSLRRLFPLHTLPKRATQKITRLSKENAHRIITRLRGRDYGMTSTRSEIPFAEEHTSMSSEVKPIYRDLVNTMKKIENEKRNRQSKKD